jgi:hypothetical protein
MHTDNKQTNMAHGFKVINEQIKASGKSTDHSAEPNPLSGPLEL